MASITQTKIYNLSSLDSNPYSQIEQSLKKRHFQSIKPSSNINMSKSKVKTAPKQQSVNHQSDQKNRNTKLNIKNIKQQTHSNNNQTKITNNQLPVNLFHSAAQYRRILITNGKSMLQNQYSVDGVITSLQYVNQSIYQAQQQKILKYRNSVDFKTIDKLDRSQRSSINCRRSVKNQYQAKKSHKKALNSTNCDCTCCCCNNFCNVCQNTAKKHKNNIGSDRLQYNSNLNNKVQVMLSKNPHSKHNYKSYNYKTLIVQKNIEKKQKQSFQNHQYLKKKSVNVSSERKNPLKNKKIQQLVQRQNQYQKRRKNSNVSSVDRKSTSKNNQNINNLLFSSLCKFQQQKRKKLVQQAYKKKSQNQRKAMMRQLDLMIRMQNKQILANQRPSSSKIKKLDKKKIAFNYWSSIQDQIKDQLSKSTVINRQFKKSKLIEQCHLRQHKLCTQEIEMFRKKYERQAKMRTLRQKQRQTKKNRKIAKSLNKLQEQRKKIINSCNFKPFKPSQKLQQQAFKNIIEK